MTPATLHMFPRLRLSMTLALLGGALLVPQTANAQAVAATRIPSLSRHLAAGRAHVLVVDGGGQTSAWGDNTTGQLGIGTTGNQKTVPQSLPQTVFSTLVTVVAGDSFSLGVDGLGTMYAWGKNDRGQLSDGTTTTRSAPVTNTYPSWRAVAAGSNHALAIHGDGSLWAWGDNAQGELGQGTTSTSPQTHVLQVGTSADTQWLLPVAGKQFSAGIKADGTLWTWGLNSSGQLGINSTTSKSAPVQVNASSWRTAALGTAHGLAIRDDGALWSWGLNDKGQLGDGSTTQRNAPVQVSAGPWVAVSAGDKFSCAIKADGSLWAWGDNTYGQLGIGNTTQKLVPTQVGTFRGWQTISAGLQFMAAVKADGTLYTWGNGSNGQIGNGATANQNAPGPIRFMAVKPPMMIAGGQHGFELRSTGILFSWGQNTLGQLGLGTVTASPANTGQNLVGTGKLWLTGAAGDSQSLAIRGDGTLWGWGGNVRGEVGDSTTTQRTSPIQIGTDSKWMAVSARQNHSFGIKADGTLWAWGENDYNQLGNGNATDMHAPVQIGSARKWSAVSTGNFYTLGIASNGTLWSWGNNDAGELGDGSTNPQASPIQIGTSRTWVAIAAGGSTSTALTADGNVWSWGDNGFGEVGDGTFNQSNTPVWVGSGYTDVCRTSFSALARHIDATISGWGQNGSGEVCPAPQPGDANLRTTLVDTQYSGGYFLACGSFFTLMYRPDGTMWSSGDNTWGQLGQDQNNVPPNGGTTSPLNVETPDNITLQTLFQNIPAQWTASSSPAVGTPHNALDGSLASRWTTGTAQVSGQSFVVDLSEAQMVSALILDAGSNTDYPRGYQIFVSNDNVSWGSAIATGTGDSEVTRAVFAPQVARFVKVVQTGSTGTNGSWWSIAEFNVAF